MCQFFNKMDIHKNYINEDGFLETENKLLKKKKKKKNKNENNLFIF